MRSSDAGATSSSISSPTEPSPMPTLSPAPSLTPSPVSTTSDNSNHRPFAGGLLRMIKAILDQKGRYAMYGAIQFAVLIIATLFIAPAVTTAASFSVGDLVVLHATSPAGVPLHREPNPSLFGRAPDGATATVRELANEGR